MSSSTCPSTLVRDRSGRLLGAAVALALIGTSLVVPRPARAGRLGRRAPVRQLHHPRRRLRPRLGHVPVRRVRGGPEGPDLEGDPRLLLPRHQADQAVRQHHPPGVGHRRHRRQRSGCCRPAASRSPTPTAAVQGADRSKYKSWRISRSGSGYQLAYRNASGVERDPVDLAVQQHLEVLSRPGSSGSCMPSGSVRPYRGSVALVKRGSGGRTVNRVCWRATSRASVADGDADLLALRRRFAPGGGCPVVRGPAARLHELRRATTSVTPPPARCTAASTGRPPTGTRPSRPRPARSSPTRARSP